MPNETIVVAGHNVWAKGETLADAKRGFTRRGGKLSEGYGILTFDQDTEFQGFDMIGRYFYVGNAPTVVTVAAKPRKPRSTTPPAITGAGANALSHRLGNSLGL